MKILITGSEGFIAKNLIVHLNEIKNVKLYLFSKSDSLDILEAYLKEVDFIFHLAGINRPKDTKIFYKGNFDLTKKIVDILEVNRKQTPIVFSSSIQALDNNDYGKSKRLAEEVLEEYSVKMQSNIAIYRLSNIFGKWSKPNYNSVIASWCHNITRDLDIKIDNEDTVLNLVYIDDVIDSFIQRLKGIDKIYYQIDTIYKKTLKEIKDLLYSFKYNRSTLVIPNVASGFERALYATYLSYLPTDKFSYELNGNKDERGTFYEVLKTQDSGQFSLSTTAVGIKRGGHYHHSKNEKFLVVKGNAIIQLRNILTNDIIKYRVSDAKMQIVEMIPGYTHNIRNIGDCELILLLWANENYNHDKPDTYIEEV